MAQKERENFLRNAILIVDHAKDSVICLVDLDLKNKHLTFEQFLNQNQHEIYHLCYNSRCCQCPRGHTPPRGGSRVLYPSQLDILYDKSLKKTNHTHGRSSDFCCSLAKTGILTSILDLTLGRCILMNFCTDVFWYSCLTKQSITLENFLNQNKHILYHLWQNTSLCCQCQPNTLISSSQQIIDQGQWTTLYTANVLPCALHRKRPNTGVQTSICAFGAKSGITVQIVDPHVNKIILENCCGVRKAVELIVQRRNHVYGHANEAKISDSDYLKFTNELGNGLIEIARVCGNESEVRQQLLDLQKRTLDETLLLQYQVIMLDHVSRDEALNNKVEEIQRQLQTQNKHLRQTVEKAVTVTLPRVLKRSVTCIENRLCLVEKSSKETNLVVKKIETQQTKNPKKSRFFDHTRKEIDQHLKEKTFVEIRAIRKFMTMHSDKDVFFITGSPGKGKSRNGLDILRQLGEKYPAYDVVKVSDLHTVDKILNEDSRTIILLEDVFGKTNYRYSEDNDRRFLDTLQAYINDGNVKVIFTVRSVIKKSLQYSPLFSSHRIFKGFEEINLNSSQFEMTIMEKERLFLNYCSKNNIKIVHVGKEENYTDGIILDKSVTVKINEATSSNIVNTEPYLGFPESCYMFTANRPLTQLGVTFFKHPTSFLNQEIDSLRRGGESNQKDRIRYITLVYILLSSNKLDKQSFDEHKASSILKSCRYRDGFISKSELVDAAEEMTGSYLTYNTETLVFQLQHQTIFESVMLSYYRLDPKSVLNMIDFEMLQEVVKLGNNSEREGEIKMIVPKNLYGDLAKRLFLIFRSQFSQTPSTFIKVLCDSDLMTHIDSDFILQLDKYFFEASNHNITTIITYDGKSEEVVFCFLAVILWYSTIKYWQSEDIKIILHSLKTTLQSETRSNVKYACKRTIIASFLHSCDKNKNNGLIELFLQTINELEIGFDINRCFQDVVERQNQLVASCILRHFSKKINIVEAVIETDREELPVLINIFNVSFFCSNVECSINDRASLIKWIFSSVNPKHFNMTEAVQTSGDKGLWEIVDWFIKTFKFNLLDWQVLMKEACSNGWEIVVRRFLQEDAHDQPFHFKSIMSAACQYSWHTIFKQLLKKSTSETFDVTLLMTEACRKFDFENVKSLIIYIGEKDINLNNTMNDVCNALKENQPWSLSEFFTSFIKVLLKHIDSDEKEDLESLNTINLLLDGISELTFNIRFALVDVISNTVIHKQRVLQLFIDNNHIKQIKVSLLLLDACRLMNYEFVKWLLKNIDNELLKVTTSFNESCTYGRLQIIKIMIQHSDHKLLNFSSAFLGSVKEEWRQHNEQNEEVMKFLLNAIDHSLFDFNTIAKEIIILGQEDVMKILLENVDIQSFKTEQVVDYACEQGHLEILEIFWKSENKEQIDIFNAVSRALKGNKQDIVNWFRAFWKRLDMKTVMNLACKLNSLDIVECILEKEDHKLLDTNSAIIQACVAGNTDIVKCILFKVNHNLIEFKDVLYKFYGYCKHYNNKRVLLILKVIVENVEWKRLDMKTVMNLACKLNSLYIIECILEKEDHKLLDTNSAIIQACEAGNTDIVKCILFKVDHNLIEFKDVLYMLYEFDEYCSNHRNESIFFVLQVLVENDDWKRLDMKTVMNLACKLNSLDIVECILEKKDHKLLDTNSAIIQACEAGTTDIVKCILVKVDHNLIEFKDVINKLYEYCSNHRNESIFLVLQVLVENVDWKQLDMKTVLNLVCKLKSLYTVECILYKVDHKLLDINSAIIQACEAGNTDIVKCILDKVDHNLIDFKDVLYKYGDEFENVDYLGVFEVIVKNVDWKRLDMKIVMNVASCNLYSSDTVQCIVDKVDHTLLNLNRAIINACKARNIDTIRYLLDKVDHNLIEFKDILYEFPRDCDEYEYEDNLLVFQAIVENVDWKRLDMKTVMNLACKLNCLDIVKCILDKVDHTRLDMKSAMMRACEAGNTDIIKCILDHVDHEMLDMNSVMTAVIKRHNLSIVKYLCNNVNKILLNMKVAFNEACKVGNLTLVKWILDNGDQSQLNIQTAMLKACRGPNDKTVKLLYQRFGENMFDIKSSMNNACRYGNIDVIRWLWRNCDKQHWCDMKSALINACLSGKTLIVEWLLKNVHQSQFDIQASITETFVNRINVTDVIKTLLNHSERSLLNMNTIIVEACAIGNMALVKWLLETNDRNLVDINHALYSVLNVHSKISENDNVYKQSVTIEKRSLVMWVLEKYSPSLFDMNNTVKEICRNGWTEILQWIWGNSQDHSLEIGPAINVACVNGHKELVEWALSNIDAKSLDTETLMNESCGNGLLTLAKWMWENIVHSKLDMRTAMNDACSYSRIETAQWILENVDANLLDTGNVLNEASKHGWLSVVKDLLKNAQLSQDDIRSTIIEACMHGNLDIVEYMFTKFGKDICDIESILPGLCSKSVNKEVAKFLISQFKNQLCLFTNVMPHACGFGWTEVVEMLLQDTDHTEIVMKDSLLNACRQGEVDVVKIILSKVDHTQIDIAEAFIVVCTRGWEEITEFLLDEIDHTAFDMKSALTEASRSGEEDIVELLFQKVKPEKFDIQMAIDAASQNHMHENIVYQLLQRNCDAKFEQDRLKKKAEEHDWPKVLSIIRKYSKRK